VDKKKLPPEPKPFYPTSLQRSSNLIMETVKDFAEMPQAFIKEGTQVRELIEMEMEIAGSRIE